ncbi:hypothetical protein [Enterocloster sp.]
MTQDDGVFTNIDSAVLM